MPTGPEAYRQLKELRPVFHHKINIVWEELGPKVCQLLDKDELVWTSIDVVRFKVEKEPVGPVVLWIGVIPETLSAKDARTSAAGCLELLQQFDIADVEVEFRNSIYIRSAGPSLLKPVSDLHPTVDVRRALTPVLGLSIAAQATPHVEGTGGLYLAEVGGSQNILLVTARHVLFPPREAFHLAYSYTHTDLGAPQRNVLLFGTRAFDELLKSIELSIRDQSIMVDVYERQIEKLQERVAGEDENDIEEATTELQQTQALLMVVNTTIEALEKFHDEVKSDWRQAKKRVIGHVVFSPPITVATEGFTEDYAVVELDTTKFKKAFKANVMDLGTP